jgi:hypothetical protein
MVRTSACKDQRIAPQAWMRLKGDMRSFIRFSVLTLGLLAAAQRVEAVPFLQLDMAGGVYDPVTETIVAPGGAFTVFAILTPKDGQIVDFTKDYFVSVALIPSFSSQPSPAPSLGSFTWGSTTVNVTADMNYGVPPVEQIVSLQGWDSGDLSKHGIFPTYFSEFKFNFSSASTAGVYNTQDDPGGPPAGTGAYQVAFTGDSSLLTSGYSLHFDLYSEKFRSCGSGCTDVDRDQFAPFSHDAETGIRRVPEPGTALLALLGMMVGFTVGILRRSKDATFARAA